VTSSWSFILQQLYVSLYFRSWKLSQLHCVFCDPVPHQHLFCPFEWKNRCILPWRRGQYFPLGRWYLSSRLRGVMTLKKKTKLE